MIGFDVEALGDLIEQRVRKVLDEREANKPTITPGPDLLSINKAAELTGYHPATIRGWLNDGKLRRHGKGRLLRVSRAELLSFVAAMGASGNTHETAKEIAARILAKREH